MLRPAWRGLAAHLHRATARDHNLHRVATAGPGVGADLPTQEATLPAHGGCFCAATGYTDVDRLVAAAARRIHAQGGLDGRWWAAAWVAGHNVVSADGECRESNSGGDRQETKSKHVIPL